MTFFQGKIDKLAFGGDGVLRSDGLVIFIPFTAPGDQIKGKITAQKKHYAKGEITEILTPSPTRTNPKCPYFGACGGCQLQHMDYQAQIDSKKEMVAEAFERIGKVSNLPIFPVNPSPSPWAYRRHVTLHLREKNGVFEAGYYAIDNESLLAIQQCPIFAYSEDSVFRELHTLLHYLQPKQGVLGRVILLKKEQRGYLLALQFKSWVEGLDKILNHSPFAGTLVMVGRKIQMIGETELFYTYAGLPFEFSPFAFIQNHPDQSRMIYEEILNTVDEGPVVDLYCGVGVTSLILAKKRFKVVGIESNPKAIELARKNGRRLGIEAEFICADAGIAFQKIASEVNPKWVIVNPPREGMEKGVLEELCKRKVSGFIYVSCMPSTMARDTQRLLEAGYRLERCRPYDMFPQTGHIETLAVFRF